MNSYKLLPAASKEFFEILDAVEEHRGLEAGEKLALNFTAALRQLASNPGLGHLRDDLIRQPYYFYLVADEYHLIYAKQIDPLPIVAILHASRDVGKLLRDR